jgi:predicted ATP-grasp superfamily ATP-dependent carboligase
VELNPRYTASVEIFELAMQWTLLAEHIRACATHLAECPPAEFRITATGKPSVVGKAILYAQRNLVAPEIEIDEPTHCGPFAVPAIADVPWPGTAIAAGEPIMTVFTTSQDARECEDRLVERETSWHQKWKA